MHRFARTRIAITLVAAGVALAACHHAPAAVAPAPAPANDDAARLARARADSIARADAARRDSIARANARADSLRRAADAARAAEVSARADLLAPVHFDFNDSRLLSSETSLLDRKVGILGANQTVRIRVDGNADERGSDEYNLALGLRRASQVRQYLSEHGIDTSRVSIASNGEEHPVCSEHEESCWSRNRRADFVIVAGGDRIMAAR